MESRKLSSLEEALKYTLKEAHRNISQTEGMSSIEEGIKAALADRKSIRIHIEETGDSESGISMKFSPGALRALDDIMQLENIPSRQEALRDAISDKLFFSEERKKGWRALLQKGTQYRLVHFPERGADSSKGL